MSGAQHESGGFVHVQGEVDPSPSEFLLSVLRRKHAAHLVAGCLIVLIILFFCVIYSFEKIIMGQSLTTPLHLTLDHLSFIAVSTQRLQAVCEPRIRFRFLLH